MSTERNMVREAMRLRWTRSALDDESGQDLLEYAMLVALIAVVTAGAVTSAGATIKTVFWDYISGVISGI